MPPHRTTVWWGRSEKLLVRLPPNNKWLRIPLLFRPPDNFPRGFSLGPHIPRATPPEVGIKRLVISSPNPINEHCSESFPHTSLLLRARSELGNRRVVKFVADRDHGFGYDFRRGCSTGATRECGARGFGPRARVYGHELILRSAQARRGDDRTHPLRDRPWSHVPRHVGCVRASHERGSHWEGVIPFFLASPVHHFWNIRNSYSNQMPIGVFWFDLRVKGALELMHVGWFDFGNEIGKDF